MAFDRDRKPSLSSTPSFISSGLLSHTQLSSPENEHSSSSGYFSLSRQPSFSSITSSISRRPSHSSPPAQSQPDHLQPPTPGQPPLHPQIATSEKLSRMFRQNTAPSLAGATGPGIVLPLGNQSAVPTSPNALYDTVHELATKRIATLDYLRRAHEGQIFWFNTYQFTRADLNRLVYTDAKKLSKRASNYFVLGNSLPSILDLGTNQPLDYLKAFNTLLQEYESHISNGTPGRALTTRTHSGSVSMGSGGMHMPNQLRTINVSKFFSRASSKPRRGSTATANSDTSDALERKRSNSNDDPSQAFPIATTPPTTASAGTGESNVEYLYLTTPALPFEVDYYETFATLCDVLIDAYSRVLGLVPTPSACGQGVGEAFLKADGKVRRLLVSGVVREFEDAARAGVKREVGAIGREVLAGIL